MGKSTDLTGQKFSRWSVLERLDKTEGHSRWYLCQCECGTIKEVRGTTLTKGNSRSCGCLSRELSSERGKKLLRKHGWYGTRLYHIWRSIKDRCFNQNTFAYNHYGGRGITICDEWENNPEAFCEWAIENGYKQGLTIDRIDVNGNYEPSNCRWITNTEQQHNRRNNVNLTYNGETHCVAEWARKLNVKPTLMYDRIRRGWTEPKEILFGRMKGEFNYGK